MPVNNAGQAGTGSRICPDWLTDCLQDIFKQHGLPADEAWLAADCLTQADLRGIYSHGSSRINIYTKRLKLGLVNPTPRIKIEQTGPGTLIVDGDNGMGAVVGHQTVKALTQCAAETGIAAATIAHSNHFGIAAVYAEAIVQTGCFALVCSNAPPTMAAHGGSQPVFGTNPIALGVPAANNTMLVTDMATSLVARGKIIRASYEGKQIPPDWALDAAGQRTTDPDAALSGVVLPFAGAKGSAIALFVDILAGVLSGGNFGTRTPDLYRNLSDPSNIGHFMLAIDISRFQSAASFYERLQQCLNMVTECPPFDSDEPVKLPGQIEAEQKAKALKSGIELPADVIKALNEACLDVGLPFAPVFR